MTPEDTNILAGVIIILLFIFSVFINMLALVYIFSKIRHRSREKIPHLFHGALSFAGLGLSIFAFPVFVTAKLTGRWHGEEGLCYFSAFTVLFFGTLTISITVAMSVERFAAILLPFSYQEHMTFARGEIALVYISLHSAVVASLPLIMNKVELNASLGVCYYASDTHNLATKVIIFVYIVQYGVYIFIMLVTNMAVVHAIRKMDKIDKKNSGSFRKSLMKNKNAPKPASSTSVSFAKMAVVLAICYSTCWSVVMIRIVLLYQKNWHNETLDQVSFLLTTIDPLINHCVSLIMMRKYRLGYLRTLQSLYACLTCEDTSILKGEITKSQTTTTRMSKTASSKYQKIPQQPQPEIIIEEADEKDLVERPGSKETDQEQ